MIFQFSKVMGPVWTGPKGDSGAKWKLMAPNANIVGGSAAYEIKKEEEVHIGANADCTINVYPPSDAQDFVPVTRSYAKNDPAHTVSAKQIPDPRKLTDLDGPAKVPNLYATSAYTNSADDYDIFIDANESSGPPKLKK